MSAIRKNRPRLKNFDYKGYHCYFVTICTHNKAPLFEDDSLVRELIKTLRDKSDAFGFKVMVFCFMPDHIHLLLQGDSPDCDLKRFISAYKQSTGYQYKKKSKLWQPSYYDHVLRKDEDMFSIAQYILGNPVRKNLATHFSEYRYVGSFTFDIRQFY